MTCPCCEKAKANPITPLVKAGCPGCAVRELARSPIWRPTLQTWRDADYNRAVAAIFGDKLDEGHRAICAERTRQRNAVKELT
jgi:hypothetical protein